MVRSWVDRGWLLLMTCALLGCARRSSQVQRLPQADAGSLPEASGDAASALGALLYPSATRAPNIPTDGGATAFNFTTDASEATVVAYYRGLAGYREVHDRASMFFLHLRPLAGGPDAFVLVAPGEGGHRTRLVVVVRPRSVACGVDAGIENEACDDAIVPPPRELGPPTVALPASVHDYYQVELGFQDSQKLIRFELPLADVPQLEKSLPCTLGPPKTRSSSETAWPRPTPSPSWYEPDHASQYRACELDEGRLHTRIVMDLAGRHSRTVYVSTSW